MDFQVEPVVVKESEKKEEPVAVAAAPEPVAELTTPTTTAEPVPIAPVVPTEPTPEPTVNAPTPTEATPEPKEEAKPAEEKQAEPEAEEAPVENGAPEKSPETPAEATPAEPTTTDEPAAVVEFGTLAAENRTKLENGEKVAYERDFLLKFQGLCLNKPIELPTLDVILDGPTDGHRKPPKHESVGGRGSWQPGYLPKGNNRKGSRNHQGKNTSVIKIPTKKPQLHSTENAYKRGIQENLEDTEKKTVALVRAVSHLPINTF